MICDLILQLESNVVSEHPYIEGDIKYFNYSIFLIESIDEEKIIKCKNPNKLCSKKIFII
jgi:hypothetical protein